MTSVQLAFEELVNALDALRIPYMVGGSLASSVRGIYRATNDIDFVADMLPHHAAQFASRLEATFYVDVDTIRLALSQRRSFNVVHLASAYKFDIFPVSGDLYVEAQMARSSVEHVALGEGVTVRCPVAAAEDILLSKLLWYRAGGEQSDRQWNDVRGIRSVQRERLDRAYLKKWAQHLKVDDLLEKLFSEEERE